MASLAHSDLTSTPRVALYARVSTEDQAEKQTVQTQLDFLRKLADLHGWAVAGEYVDDGVSGTIPLDARPDGRRLLADATEHRFTAVVLYRLDRLGRKVRVLLDAHQTLEASGVAIKSGTEPFDTSTPIGTFVFQLLGSIAELERSTISERMTMGRDRVARAGKWTGGPVPFGYDLDAEGCLIPSGQLATEDRLTEADVARSIFERIAAGASATEEARRLSALGVPCERRYAGGAVYAPTGTWRPGRITRMVHNPLYEGRHLLHSQHGMVERPVPALVTPELRAQAQAQLQRNRRLAQRNAQQHYLLRGLITCQCGVRYAGAPVQTRGRVVRYYRCGGQCGAIQPDPAERCRAKRLAADPLEARVWQDCREFIFHPGETLAEAQRQLRARMEESTGLEQQRTTLQQQLADKEQERERVLTLYRRNRMTLQEAETHLDDISRQVGTLRGLLDALDSQQALAAAYETHLTGAATLLTQLQARVDEIECTDDWATKRQVVELLVAGIHVQSTGSGRRTQARVTIKYAFAPPVSAVVSPMTPRRASCAASPRPG